MTTHSNGQENKDIIKKEESTQIKLIKNAGKKFIYFIDDINLHQLDVFGSQQPIELINLNILLIYP